MGTVKRVTSPMMVKLKDLAKGMDTLAAKVGWFEGNNYPNGGPPVAYVAAIMEHGAPSVGVPPRPFIRPTVSEQQGEWARVMGVLAKRVVKGTMTPNDAFDAMGLQAVGDIQRKISTYTEGPELSKTTLMIRRFKMDPSSIPGGDVFDAVRANNGRISAYKQVMATREYIAEQEKAGTLDFGGVSRAQLRDTGRLMSTITFVTGLKDGRSG